MSITFEDLTVNFDKIDRATLLDEWRWLIDERYQPVLLTALGDVFLQDENSGKIHFLNVATAKKEYVCDGIEEFQMRMSDRQFVFDHFAVNLVSELIRCGEVLNPGQVYSFKLPPSLGGTHEVDNIEAVDINVHFSLAGQIHQKTHNIPEGTAITGVRID